MQKTFHQLKEVLIEGNSAVDIYIEILHKFINMLEKKSKGNNDKRELQKLKLQYQSLLLTLLMFKDIQRKKLNLLGKFPFENKNILGSDKVITIKLLLKNRNRGGPSQINLRINLRDYYYWRSKDKLLKIKIHLKDYRGRTNKTITLNLNLADLKG